MTAPPQDMLPQLNAYAEKQLILGYGGTSAAGQHKFSSADACI